MKSPIVRVTLRGKRSWHARRFVFFREQGIEDRCASCFDSAWNGLSFEQAKLIEESLSDALGKIKEYIKEGQSRST